MTGANGVSAGIFYATLLCMSVSTPENLKFTLREEADERAYAEARAAGTLPKCRYCVVKNVVKEYEHFLVMVNDFPYTRVAKTSHMISPKRHVASFYEFTDAERAEFEKIYVELDRGVQDGSLPAYDQIIKSTTHNMSIPGHVHLHLIQFRDK
jgi:diadenosine tetraphosphate (Ap4A) HIT family hydrolase